MNNTELEFLKDEVRCGFYVPTAVKVAWLAELKVLKEIDRICERHAIKYFADWGTLLGAVRHGGFVPWDDDMDICMTRDDYEKFMAVADDELPPEFRIQNYERQPDHWFFITRIVSSAHICFEEDYLTKYHNFPYIAGIDIFLIDYLYEDVEKEKARDEEVKEILAVAGKFTDHEELSEHTLLLELNKFKEKYGAEIPYGNGVSERDTAVALYKLAESQMARVPKGETSKAGQIFPWVLKNPESFRPKSWYEHPVRLPFEFTTIPVESDYLSAIANRYGSYLEVHKVWGGHDYPFFEGQKENLQKVVDFKLPEFTFDKKMLEKPGRGCEDGHETEAVTRKKQILFITTGGTKDVNFTKAYAYYSSMADTDVYALTVPVLFKDPYGQPVVDGLTADEYEMLDFTFSGLFFDIIFIEDPYDNENPALTLPPQYYAEKLYHFCTKLVFIEPFEICDFSEEDHNDCANMKYYVSTPGMVYADEIWVSKENTRENFVRRLTEWAGEETKEIWEKKTKILSDVLPDSASETKQKRDDKKIVYAISLSNLNNDKEKFIKAISKRVEVFKEEKEKIGVAYYLFPHEVEEWKQADHEAYEKIVELIGSNEIIQSIDYDDIVGKYDAYYGDPSPLVLKFTEAGKPVMIQNIDVDL